MRPKCATNSMISLASRRSPSGPTPWCASRWTTARAATPATTAPAHGVRGGGRARGGYNARAHSAISPMTQDDLKKAVAQAAIDYTLSRIDDDSIIGIGTGSTANFFIDGLADHRHRFAGTVASSEASAARLRGHGIEVYDLNSAGPISLYIDGADEANPRLELIKGGGAALTREKIVAAVAREFVCIADDSKWVDHLGTFPLPVEVIPMARSHVARQLLKLGGDPVYREGVLTLHGTLPLAVLRLPASASPRPRVESITCMPGVATRVRWPRRQAEMRLRGSRTAA